MLYSFAAGCPVAGSTAAVDYDRGGREFSEEPYNLSSLCERFNWPAFGSVEAHSSS
jgi:hypothetical protein